MFKNCNKTLFLILAFYPYVVNAEKFAEKVVVSWEQLQKDKSINSKVPSISFYLDCPGDLNNYEGYVKEEKVGNIFFTNYYWDEN